ncbi:MAG: rhamnan synthesis F family protein [Sphingobium sp.]
MAKSISKNDLETIRSSERLCLFAHYNQDNIVAEYVFNYLASLKEAGFITVVTSTSKISDSDTIRLEKYCLRAITRENEGLDFGGWIALYTTFQPIQAHVLLLTNDSVYGPTSSLTNFMDRLWGGSNADFFGAVESFEGEPHLQSWFLALRPAAYSSTAFQRLMARPMLDLENKLEIVRHYEVGLTRALIEDGLRYEAAFSPANHGGIAQRYPYNPSHVLWKEMMEDGVPFVKVDLLRRNPFRVPDLEKAYAWLQENNPEFLQSIKDDLSIRGCPTPGVAKKYRSNSIVYEPWLRWIILKDYRDRFGKKSLWRWPNELMFGVLLLFAKVHRRTSTLLADGRGFDPRRHVRSTTER